MSTSRLPAMIARNFFRTLIMRSPFWSATVPRLLQPRLRSGGAPFPAHDLGHVLEREADIVQPFDEARAICGRDLESNVRTARPADALRDEIDRERRRAVDGDDPRREGIVLFGAEHDGQQAV